MQNLMQAKQGREAKPQERETCKPNLKVDMLNNLLWMILLIQIQELKHGLLKNSWFGTDRAMTYTAFEIHKDLTEKEGYDPNSDEYYAEVDKRMRVDFPHKFGNTEEKQSTAPVQTVASANRSVKPGRKTVRLTSSQVAIAKKLGVPLEEYAKQLKNTEGA